MDPKTEARIRDRAYQLWQEAGAPHGQADAYWYRAEQELLGEQAMSDSQISAHEEGPDRDAERLSGDGVTAGEAGPGHPQKPGEKLAASPPITAPKRAASGAKPVATKPAAGKAASSKPAAAKAPPVAAPQATAAKSSATKPSSAISSSGKSPSSAAKSAAGAGKARKGGPSANGAS